MQNRICFLKAQEARVNRLVSQAEEETMHILRERANGEEASVTESPQVWQNAKDSVATLACVST